MSVNRWVSFINVVLWSVNTALCVPSGKCSVSVHSTRFQCTVWKVFCFCAQYRFLVYRPESVLFLYTVQVYSVPSGKCSVSVHSTGFWCTVRKVFCFCAQYRFLVYRPESVLSLYAGHIFLLFGKCSTSAHYTFQMYHLESVLFLCIVLISDTPSANFSVSVHSTYFCTVSKVFCICAQ